MTRRNRNHLSKAKLIEGALLVTLLGLLQAQTVTAQATAEAAGTASVGASVTAATPKPNVVMPADHKAPGSSAHITSATSASNPEANRAALESKAGKDAASLLLRSSPSQAQVWIDGKAVGTTPLLLIVAPGKYKIELRGAKQEHAERECALLPKEAQELAIKLEKQYPNRVVSHY